MKALVIANGSIKNKEFYHSYVLKDHFDLIICADGGLKNALLLNLTPNVVIGDFDSTEESLLQDAQNKGVEIIRYPVEKDATDTEIVLDYLVERDFFHITMIGCLGDRVDHTLANIALLKKLLAQKVCGRIVDEKNEIYLINGKIELSNRKGSTLSLIPFSEEVEGVTTSGLYYSLNDYKMVQASSYGISNIIIEDSAKVEIKNGELLAIISRD